MGMASFSIVARGYICNYLVPSLDVLCNFLEYRNHYFGISDGKSYWNWTMGSHGHRCLNFANNLGNAFR